MKSLRESEREITISAPWGKIAGITWGNPDNPPVLLCPGRIDPCCLFRYLVMRLPSNFFYVAVDLPGNGLSDHLPVGIRFSVWDLVPTVSRVADHYQWNKFIYIGHSLGTAVGKHYLMAYPERLTRVVELDPVPAYHTVFPEEMKDWYHEVYGKHYEERQYRKHAGSKATAPRYTYDQIKTLLMKAQDFSEAVVEEIITRHVVPAGDNLYRFTYDQRMKSLFKLPYLPEQLKAMYTSHRTPLLTIFSSSSVDKGDFSRVPFVFDEEQWPHRNYKYMIVEGSHEAYAQQPQCMSDDISKFLLNDLKSKL
ncbi:serine hydrolase-like protein isoform X2 [Danaus plexippus]|nr:serine hydrolase-like protein isoform X2 [Danaus plexippus]